MHSTAYVTKHLCFINLDTNEQTALCVSLQNILGELNLANIIQQFNETEHVGKRQFAIDPAGNQPFDRPYLLNRSMFCNNPLILYYRDELEAEFQENDQGERKERNKERTIREVIKSIKKWRSFHKKRINGVKVSLVQAAEMVGISKKSLDDYFCQLRLGEKHGFEFMDHLDEKVGVLRAFVKKNRPKHDRNHKNQKHPKTLKIIENYQSTNKSQESSHHTSPKEEPQDPPVEDSVKQKNQVVVPQPEVVETVEDNTLTPMDKQQAEELENQFYQLDLILNEPTDPFVHYLARDYREFKIKNYGFMDNPLQSEDFEQQDEFMW